VADGLLLDHLLLSANYRWVDGFRYSPVVLAQGAVSEPRTSAYQTLDAKVAYTVPGLKTTFTLGASNLLNQYYQTLSQAPSIGGIYYLKVSFDEFLNR
jgi:outer membrane receptor protein involved in Fe transport